MLFAFTVAVSQLCLLRFYTGCASVENYRAPYSISAAASGGEFSYCFYNRSSAEVSACTVKFRLYDEDGLPPAECPGECEVACCETVKPYASYSESVNLESECGVLPGFYQVESVYVSRIEYADGREWKDEYGNYGLK